MLLQHEYSRAFLANGEEKTLTVELGDGRSIRLRHWGGPECDPELPADGGV